MINAELEAQHQTVLYYWLNGVHTAEEIHRKTKQKYIMERDDNDWIIDIGEVWRGTKSP